MSKTILTIDDSASIRQMVSMTLTAAGFEVIEAAKEHFHVTVEEISIKDENVVFKIPKVLSA